jgi:activating signal cointegrator complex subunit 3
MWLHMDESDLDRLDVKDQHLRLTLAFGIGMHHAGLVERDRKTVEELFVNQKIQVRFIIPAKKSLIILEV